MEENNTSILEEAKELARKQGREEGLEKGREEGIKLAKKVFKLLNSRKSVEEIATICNMSVKKVKDIIE